MTTKSIEDLLSVPEPLRERLRRTEAIIRAASIVGTVDMQTKPAPEGVAEQELLQTATITLLLLEAARLAKSLPGGAPTQEKPERTFKRLASRVAAWMNDVESPQLADRGLLSRRRHNRITLATRRSLLRLSDGHDQIVNIRDVSASGVSVETDRRPPLGARIHIGKTPATVVRHLDNGIAAEFDSQLPSTAVEPNMRL